MVEVDRLRLGRPRDWLLGAALLVVVLVAVQFGLGWRALLAPWATLPPLLLAGAFGLTAASYSARAVRVRVYFATELAGRFPAVVRLSFLHNTANNLLPMRVGEMVFPWLMRRYFGHGFLAAGASLLWIRLMDLHFLALIAIFVLWLRAPELLWLWMMIALAWLALLPLGWGLVGWVGAGRGAQGVGWLGRVVGFLVRVAPATLRRLGLLYLWTAVSWSLKFVAFALILGHFLPLPIWQVILGVMGAELSSVLPFHGIAGSGSYELATVAALVPFGVEPADALSGAVNLHLFLLGSTLLLGLGALLIRVQGRGGAARDVPG